MFEFLECLFLAFFFFYFFFLIPPSFGPGIMESNPVVRIEPCSTGGNRLVTKSPVKAGEVVVKEKPLVDATIFQLLNKKYNERMAWRLVDIILQNPALVKRLLEHRPPFARGLAAATWEKEDTHVLDRLLVESPKLSRHQIKEVYDIVATCNIVTQSANILGRKEAVVHGFFIILSFVDHACHPNTEMTTDSEGNTVLRALYDIPKDATVTYRYIETLYKADDRVFPGPPDVELLRTQFNFECACATCTGKCVVCDKAASTRCNDCEFTVMYCGKECKEIHWTIHQKEHHTP